MRADSGLASLYAQAARATAAGSKSFHFATRFFPAGLARSAHAVYWFCRVTDDLADECATLDAGRRDLEAWNHALVKGVERGDADHPVLRVFLDTVGRHSIPTVHAFELIEGMRMDLDGVRYATFADLRLFCYRVASTVGLMMSHVIGFEDPARQTLGLAYAAELGVAMQLTNILRDVGEDLDRGRLYLPQEDLDRFAADPRRRLVDDGFRALMRFEIGRARTHYAQARPGIPLLHSRGRFAVETAASVYSRILKQIEANDFDVFRRRAVVPAPVKCALVARIMAGPAWRHWWAAAR